MLNMTSDGTTGVVVCLIIAILIAIIALFIMIESIVASRSSARVAEARAREREVDFEQQKFNALQQDSAKRARAQEMVNYAKDQT